MNIIPYPAAIAAFLEILNALPLAFRMFVLTFTVLGLGARFVFWFVGELLS